MMENYQICKRCIMDNRSDKSIVFDENGYCNYCTNSLKLFNKVYFPNEEGQRRLENLINRLKEQNKNNDYDCIMGISGGLDSSYLAYLGAEKWGLRILALHVDDGFDTDISKRNIEKLCKAANINLVTINPDEKQFNELTRAYMIAGVPNLAIPQDNVLFASIYKYMKDNNLKTFLSGGNFALESVLQEGNTHDAYDLRNIKDINRKFGRSKIDKLALISNFKRDLDRSVLKIESLRPLNLIDYDKDRAFKELDEFCGFEYYGSKHLENTLTKFIQLYWFVKKFNVDKRASHLSSMIVSGKLSREEALELMKKPLYNELEMESEIAMILARLDLTKEEFDEIMKSPPKQHDDYKTSYYNLARNYIRKFL